MLGLETQYGKRPCRAGGADTGRRGPIVHKPVPGSVEQTFGFMGDDPEYDEIVRLGREYRQQANDESP